MSIRNSIKAILIKNGKVLLSKCNSKTGSVYYDLPGGGQNKYEPAEEALVRELLEETGILVRPVRLAAVAEEIYKDSELRLRYPEYTHRVFHIYIVQPVDEAIHDITEPDSDLIENEWIDVDEVPSILLRPYSVGKNFTEIINSGYPVYFKTDYV